MMVKKTMQKIKASFIVLAGTFITLLTVIFSQMAFAVSNINVDNIREADLSDDVFAKALFTGVYTCYESGYMRSSLNYSSTDLTSYEITNNSNESLIPLPNSKTRLKDGDVSCNQLFYGYEESYTRNAKETGANKFSGLLYLSQAAGNINSLSYYDVTPQRRLEFLENMGYTLSGSGSTTGGESVKCLNVDFRHVTIEDASMNNPNGETVTKTACFNVDASGNVQSYNAGMSSFNNAAEPIGIKITGSGASMDLYVAEEADYNEAVDRRYYYCDITTTPIASLSISGAWNTFKADFTNKFTGFAGKEITCSLYQDTYSAMQNGGSYWYETTVESSAVASNNTIVTIGESERTNAANKAVSTLSGGAYTKKRDLEFVTSDLVELYGSYLKDVYGMKLVEDAGTNISNDDVIDYTKISEADRPAVLGDGSDFIALVAEHYYIRKTPHRNNGKQVYDVACGRRDICYFSSNTIEYADVVRRYGAFLQVEVNQQNAAKCLEDYETQLANAKSFKQKLGIRISALEGYSGLLSDLIYSFKNGRFASQNEGLLKWVQDVDQIVSTLDSYKNTAQSELSGKNVFGNVAALDQSRMLIGTILGGVQTSGAQITGGLPTEDQIASLEFYLTQLNSEANYARDEYYKPLVEYIDQAQEAYDNGKESSGEIYDTSAGAADACPGLDKYIKPIQIFLDGLGFEGTGLSSDWDPAASVEDILGPDVDNPNGEEGLVEEDPCYRSGEALGWILCPITSGLTKVMDKAYRWIESNFLQIRPQIFTDESNGVREAWSQMLNIANIGFMILFLLVIFSQVTGYGIDNYGIKKLLPKLIVCAVIMNLSYIICELLIDVSNIFGTGLNSMMSGMGPELSASANSYAPSGGQYAVVGIGVVAAAIGMILAYGGLGAVMMLVIALVACVLAILTLFVILVIRQAGVVICVITMPIAILCKMLPNTEKVYKRWFDLMKGFLVVYPICGLVVGAGDLVARIFGNLAGGATEVTQVGFALGAMLVQVIPYFFIPTLLRGSLAAMGNLGAKIQGVGRGLGNRAGRAIKSSDAMKASRMRANDQRTLRKAGVNAKTGELNLRGRARARVANTGVGKVLGMQRLQAARVQAAQEIRGKNIGAAAALTGAVATSAMQKAGQTPEQYYEEQLKKAADSGNLTAYETAIEAALASGQLKDKDVAAMNRRQVGKLQSTVGDDGTRQNFYRKMAAKYGNGFLATDTEQRAWLQNSGQLKVGRTRTNFTLHATADGSYAAAGGMEPSDIKLGDVQKMSGDDMAAMIEQGVLSQGLATEARKHGGLSDDKKIMLALHENNLIPTGMTAAQIKSLSGDLTNPKNAAKYTAALGAFGITPDQVKMWTSPMPEDVILRDVSIRNEKDGTNQQTHDLYVRENGGAQVNPPPKP